MVARNGLLTPFCQLPKMYANQCYLSYLQLSAVITDDFESLIRIIKSTHRFVNSPPADFANWPVEIKDIREKWERWAPATILTAWTSKTISASTSASEEARRQTWRDQTPAQISTYELTYRHWIINWTISAPTSVSSRISGTVMDFVSQKLGPVLRYRTATFHQVTPFPYMDVTEQRTLRKKREEVCAFVGVGITRGLMIWYY